jgi:hypothetical protein
MGIGKIDNAEALAFPVGRAYGASAGECSAQ